MGGLPPAMDMDLLVLASCCCFLLLFFFLENDPFLENDDTLGRPLGADRVTFMAVDEDVE